MKAKRLLSTCVFVLILVLLLAGPDDSAAQGPSSLTVLISGPTYDQGRNLYRGRITVNDPKNVYRLLYSVEDADAGTVIIPETEINLGGFNARPYELNGALFKPERKYVLKVQAVDWSGNLIPRAAEGHLVNPGEQFILASKEFVHLPPAPPRFEFRIESVNADYAAGTLIIRLNLPSSAAVLKYDGFIVDDSGQRVGVIQEALYRDPEVVATLPASIREATEERAYKVTLNLYTRDDQQAQATYEVKLKPPPQPSLWQRVTTALAQNPYIALAILVVFSMFVIAIILSGRSGRTDRPPWRPPIPGRPPIDLTRPGESPIARGWLTVRVIESPGTSRGTEQRITHFPCVIGREENCDIRIEDPNVSRTHLKITYQGGRFFATDVSKNGTFIGDTPLQKNIPTPIPETAMVRLGNTRLELITGD